MKNFTSLFARLVLALTLATGAGAAMAVPTSYHFTIDTAKFGVTEGYLDLGLIGYATTDMATAMITNFTGGAAEASFTSGTATGSLSTSATLTASGESYIDQLIQFGGVINFDVLFSYALTGAPASFEAAFYNMDFTTMIITPGPFATVLLSPGAAIEVATNAGFVTVSENAAAVPEPGQWLLMLSGLLLMGAMVRRRNM
jgi:hypothetical protein